MSALEQFDKALEQLDVEETQVMATVQERLEDIDARRSRVREEREKALEERLLELGPLSFIDPEKAKEAYELAYDHGNGSAIFMDLYEELLEGTYLSCFSGWWTNRNGENPVRMPSYHLEGKSDAQMEERSIELFEELYSIGQQINPSLEGTILYFSTTYRVIKKDGVWQSPGHATLGQSSFKTLSELFSLIRGDAWEG